MILPKNRMIERIKLSARFSDGGGEGPITLKNKLTDILIRIKERSLFDACLRVNDMKILIPSDFILSSEILLPPTPGESILNQKFFQF